MALGSVSLGLAAVILILRTTGTLAPPPPRGEGIGSAFFVLGVWNFVLAVLSLRLERRDTGSAPRLYRFGFLLVWLVPLGLTGLFLAEASYLFVWPGLAGVFAVALAGESTPRRVALRSVAAVLLGLPSILLLVSATYLLFLAAAPDQLLAIVICSVFATLTLTLLVPQLRLLSPAAPRRVFVLGAVGAVLAFALEFLASRLQ